MAVPGAAQPVAGEPATDKCVFSTRIADPKADTTLRKMGQKSKAC